MKALKNSTHGSLWVGIVTYASEEEKISLLSTSGWLKPRQCNCGKPWLEVGGEMWGWFSRRRKLYEKNTLNFPFKCSTFTPGSSLQPCITWLPQHSPFQFSPWVSVTLSQEPSVKSRITFDSPLLPHSHSISRFWEFFQSFFLFIIFFQVLLPLPWFMVCLSYAQTCEKGSPNLTPTPIPKGAGTGAR